MKVLERFYVGSEEMGCLEFGVSWGFGLWVGEGMLARFAQKPHSWISLQCASVL